MQVNWDSVKHTAGVVCLAGIVPAASVPVYGKWIGLACGLVAFMCGVQSEKMFTKSVVDTLAPKEDTKP